MHRALNEAIILFVFLFNGYRRFFPVFQPKLELIFIFRQKSQPFQTDIVPSGIQFPKIIRQAHQPYRLYYPQIHHEEYNDQKTQT